MNKKKSVDRNKVKYFAMKSEYVVDLPIGFSELQTYTLLIRQKTYNKRDQFTFL